MKTNTKTSRNHDVYAAATHISDKLGSKVSPRSFSRFDIPYKIIIGRRIYEEADLDAWVARKLASAPRRIAKAV